MGVMEVLFDIPVIYRLKRYLSFRIGVKIDINIEQFIKDKKVLDIGCGPLESNFCLSLAASLIGLDRNWKAIKAASERKICDCINADALRLPFFDNTFDTVVFSGVMHHIPADPRNIVKEAARVARKYIVLYEPEQSSTETKRFIKSLWWRFTDGGCSYNTREEWDQILAEYRRIKELHTGRLWENAFYCVISIEKDGIETDQNA